MIDVKELLRRWSAGHSTRKIARETGTDRGTATRYIAVAEHLALPRDRDLTEAEIHEVAQRVQARPLPDPSAERTAIAAHRQHIVDWLGRKRPLRLTKIHRLLVRDHGLVVSYDTLRRYAMEELGWQKKEPTILLEDPLAGQEAQVDFGKMGMLLDPATGRPRALWALIITLSFSRYQFVWPTFVQTTEAVCEGLDRAWWFFGAMAKTIVPDNMKAIIKTPDALNPTIAVAFLDYVQARGIFVDPARVRSPKDKPRVENQVPYVRESWCDGETFTGLADAQRSAEHWSRDIAGMRVHGTTRRVPREAFEEMEKSAMLAPPTELFDVPLWAEHAKVHPDHHVEIARSLYSVPTLYRNKEVRVRADKTTVKIYFGTDLIKLHPRKPPGGRSTDTNDYPVGKAAYALRSVDGLIAKAKDKGAHVGVYAERLLGGPLPWTRMRQAYALLRLCENRRWTRRGRLPERARVRRRRHRAHHAASRSSRNASRTRASGGVCSRASSSSGTLCADRLRGHLRRVGDGWGDVRSARPRTPEACPHVTRLQRIVRVASTRARSPKSKRPRPPPPPRT